MRRSATLRTLLIATWSAVPSLGAIAGCFQELDPGAASGAGLSSVDGGDDADNADAFTTWQLCQSPSCDLPSGAIPYLDQTPPIYLPDGGTTTDPCVDVEQASMTVRQTYCAQCHEGPGAQGGLGFVLDDGMLSGALSQTATDDAGQPERLVVAGDPLHSLLYVRVAQGLSGSTTGMPPVTMAGYTSIPRPTASDLSVLYAWIAACLPGTDAGFYASGGVDYAPGASDGGGD
jgi:hypothetical protein